MHYEITRRYIVTAAEGLAVYPHPSGEDSALSHLPEGTILVCAELLESAAAERRMRISAPAGWIDPSELAEAPKPSSFALAWPEFEENHTAHAAGDHYGIPFPLTHAEFKEMGAAFLTKAFHAAGTLSPKNEVIDIHAYHQVDGGGASITAAFDVRYANELRPTPPKTLFAKMPASDIQRKFVSSHMLFGETEFARLSSKLELPIDVSRYVFGDYCQLTANGILITERIGFGDPPIEKAHPKGLDALLQDADEHYRALNGLLAQLVAFHKRGGFGPQLEEIFPFRSSGGTMPPVAIDGLLDFITHRVPHLLPPEMSSPTFLTRLEKDAGWILAHLKELATALHRDVDYTGFCHANLNLDNAWFWRDAEGQLQAGLIDWGAAGQMSIGQAFYGMLFASEPVKMLPLRRALVDSFIEDYAEASGIRLDFDALLSRAKIACLLNLPMIVFASQQFLQNYAEIDLGQIEGLSDPSFVNDDGFQTMFAMLGNCLMEWFDDDFDPVEACRACLKESAA